MKQIHLILFALVMLTACHKNSNPAPQPANNTSTNNGGNNNTNDTTGKIKIFFTVNLACVITSSDYINGATNMRVYHNADTIKIQDLYYHNHVDTSYNSGIELITNFNEGNYFTSITPKPIWMALGDSITFEMDKTEYANGLVTGFFSDNFYVFDGHKPYASAINSHINNVVAIQPLTHSTDTYLGTGYNVSNGQVCTNSVYLAGKTRITYVLPLNYH